MSVRTTVVRAEGPPAPGGDGEREELVPATGAPPHRQTGRVGAQGAPPCPTACPACCEMIKDPTGPTSDPAQWDKDNQLFVVKKNGYIISSKASRADTHGELATPQLHLTTPYHHSCYFLFVWLDVLGVPSSPDSKCDTVLLAIITLLKAECSELIQLLTTGLCPLTKVSPLLLTPALVTTILPSLPLSLTFLGST